MNIQGPAFSFEIHCVNVCIWMRRDRKIIQISIRKLPAITFNIRRPDFGSTEEILQLI